MTPKHTGLILVLLTLATSVTWVAPAQAAASTANQQKSEQLIATLLSEDATRFDKVEACRQLAVVGTPEAVPTLAALLSDAELAHMARYALEPMPNPAVDAAFFAALGQLKGQLLIGVINSIGTRGDANAVDPLIQLLDNDDAEVAAAAAAALGRIGNLNGAIALQSALANTPATNRPRMADACLVCAERLTDQDQAKAAIRLYEAVLSEELPGPLHLAALRGIIINRGDAGLPMLIDLLKDPDTGRSGIALSLARELPGTATTRALADSLDTLSGERQPLLLIALTDRADAEALPAILAAAQKPPTATRVAALNALAVLGDASVVSPLLIAANDDTAEVSRTAYNTLAALKGADVDRVLAAQVASAQAGIRLAAMEALALRRAGSAVPELSQAATDPSAEIRVAALTALGETVGLRDLEVIIRVLVTASAPQEIGAADGALSTAVERIQDKPAIAEQLLAVLPKASPPVRGRLLIHLVAAGGGEALQAVLAGTRDSDATVRASAVEALAGWPDAAAVPELGAILSTNPDAATQATAFRGYVRLVREVEAPATEKVKWMQQVALLAVDVQKRRAVLSALGDIRDMGAWRLMTKYLDDPSLANEVGAAAVKLSKALGDEHKTEIVPVLQQLIEAGTGKPVLDALREQLKTMGVPAD